MFLRIDKLQVELPAPKDPDPNAAAAVQELMSGRFGDVDADELHVSVVQLPRP
jgi:Mn-containing catalase